MAQLIRFKLRPHKHFYDKKISSIIPNKVISISEDCLNKNIAFYRDKKAENIRELIRSFVSSKEALSERSHERSNRHHKAMIVRDVLVFVAQWFANLKQEVDLIMELAKSIAENVCKGPVSFTATDFDGVIRSSLREYFKIYILVSEEKRASLSGSFSYLLSVFHDKHLFRAGGRNNQASLNLVFSEKTISVTFDERDVEKILMAFHRIIQCSNNTKDPNEKNP